MAHRGGGLDGLVNVAGGFKWETMEAGSIETWDRLYALNLRTAVLASQAALPHLRRMAESDPHPEVRAAAAQTLALFFADAPAGDLPCPA